MGGVPYLEASANSVYLRKQTQESEPLRCCQQKVPADRPTQYGNNEYRTAMLSLEAFATLSQIYGS